MRLIVLISLLFLSPVQAKTVSEPTRPVVLTISGGVSLGSYESGLLFYLSNFIKRQRASHLSVVAGASAGSANGLIAILNSCAPQTFKPEESLGWQVWQPVGLKQLGIEDQVTAVSILSKDALLPSLNKIRAAWKNGLNEKCDVVYTATLTRKIPMEQEVRPGIFTSRVQEFVALRIRGQGAGHAPLVENFMVKQNNGWQVVLPLNQKVDHDFDLITRTMLASASFPVAFAPEPLRHCFIKSDSNPKNCSDQNAIQADFIDGGVFDNTPVRLAHRIAEQLIKDPKIRAQITYTVVNADGVSHPAAPAVKDPKKLDDLENTLWRFASNVVSTARGQEVSLLYSDTPALVHQTLSNPKVFPPAGSFYYAFSGFLDQGFREYDFILGMWEARHLIKRGLKEQGFSKKIHLITDKMPEDFEVSTPAWDAFYCFRALESQGAESTKRCTAAQSNESSAYKLFQATISLVYERCRLNSDQDKHYPGCEFAKTSVTPMQPDESDAEYFFRALDLLKYKYADAPDAIDGRNVLRAEVAPLLRKMSNLQPKDDRSLVRGGTHLLLDSIYYTPTPWNFQFSVGSAPAFGASWLMSSKWSERPWFRLDGIVILNGFETLLNRTSDRVGFLPMLGIDMDVTNSLKPWIRPHFVLRGGKQFSTDHNVGCENNGASCDSWVIEPAVRVNLLDRIRVEFGGLFYLDSANKTPDAIFLLGWQWDNE